MQRRVVCPWFAGFTPRCACVLLFVAHLRLFGAVARGNDELVTPTTDGMLAYEDFDETTGMLRHMDGGFGWKRPWASSHVSALVGADVTGADGTLRRGVLIQGTGARNNPLRRELSAPLNQRQFFVRFDLHYLADPTAAAGQVDPEFFVLWLDRLDGGDRATHASSTPNIGVHIADRGPQKGRNVFMVRMGPDQVAWSKVELQAGRTYQVVGCLTKTREGARAEYDRFELWIDPQRSDRAAPDATLSGAASLSLIQWVGFATGLKTEATDQIHVSRLGIGSTWESVLDVSAALQTPTARRGHNGVVWDQTVDFRRDVYPLLNSRCFDCHSGPNPDSGRRLDVYRELLGYSTGEMLAEPGHSHRSRLIEVVSAESPHDRMPPDGDEPLTAEQIAMLRAWIDQGLAWDEELLPTPVSDSSHWAFQPLASPEIPRVEQAEWVRTPVDAFIAERHAAAGLTHAPEADSLTLIRRLYLDLLGLPPTPDEVQAFQMDESPGAYVRLVERLLESPHYGERWGRYWLDLARWAESQGYQHDIVRPYAWRYRDYVIQSFNADKPYDRFLREQLAGDELQPYADENLIATGFLGAARISGNEENEDIQRNDVLVDIVNATGSVVLGLTLECAQCHNHKFDPITQRDYYRMQAFFVRGQLGNLSLREKETPHPTDVASWVPEAAYQFYINEVKSLTRKKLYAPAEQPSTWGYLSAHSGDPGIERFSVVNRKPIEWRPALLRQAQARILIGGDVAHPGAQVEPGWPEILGVVPDSLGQRPRTVLADWLADPRNPLVARVWVNRLWQYHFGRGIVATTSDFGTEGADPTHPELLDWLASELLATGWSTKHVHRLIVLSATYRQQRSHNAANAAIDHDNRLLWCWPLRRLEAEAIRDSVLVATGELERDIGGVSVPPEREEERLRRTIYLFQQRSRMPAVMTMFDAPAGIASCARRPTSTVALQPLFMLNSQFMARRAAALAARVTQLAGDDIDRQIRVAFERTLSREPVADELAMARRIVHPGPAETVPSDEDPGLVGLTQLCHALLNVNEFVYIP